MRTEVPPFQNSKFDPRMAAHKIQEAYPMQQADNYERLGKVIGTALAALVYIAVIAMVLNNLLR